MLTHVSTRLINALFIMYSTFHVHNLIAYNFVGERNLPISHYQYYGFWWLGDTMGGNVINLNCMVIFS